MFYFLSKTVDFFAAPLTLILILLLWGWWRTSRKQKAGWQIGSAVLLIYLLSNGFLVYRVFSWWEWPYRNLSEVKGGYEVGVVLTGGITQVPTIRADHPGFGAAGDRLLQAYQLYRSGKIRRILISGTDTPQFLKLKLDDAQQSRTLLEKWGVDPAHIYIETRSRNTRENAVFSSLELKKLGFPGSYLLITSAFHMPRAKGCFEKAGLQVDCFAADFYAIDATGSSWKYKLVPDARAFGDFALLWREMIGYVVYSVVGYC